jgi:hypothetical protein
MRNKEVNSSPFLIRHFLFITKMRNEERFLLSHFSFFISNFLIFQRPVNKRYHGLQGLKGR